MYTGNILDPIHGLIKLSEIEKWIIAQKPFNRLKRVKQNTFLYLVFPSANHTRFEHSIGVMHLAHLIYRSANDNFDTSNYKREKHKLEETSFYCSVSKLLAEDEEVIIQELRLAGLLHDVGHGPMSHKFDEFTISGNRALEIIKTDEDLLIYYDNFQNLISQSLKGKLDNKIEHEIVSCIFIIKLLSDLKKTAKEHNGKFINEQYQIIEKINPARVVKMIEPKFDALNKIEFNGFDFTNFFNSIISSFPLDADRMDYLYRDSYFSGVKYGLYDLSRILMSFVPVLENKMIFLSIKESGIDSIVRFIQSRTHLYNQVYFHKTNRASMVMLDFACRKLDLSKSIIKSKDFQNFQNFYWENSDELFLWRLLKEEIKSIPESEVFEELLTRKLWKRIYEKKIYISPLHLDDKVKQLGNEKIKQQIKDQIKSLEDKGIYVQIDLTRNNVFKDADKSKLKIIQKKSDGYEIQTDWTNFNTELKILQNITFTFRIYLRRTFKSPKEFNDNKKLVKDEFEQILKQIEQI